MSTYKTKNNDGSIAFGFIVLGIGVILLLRKMGFFIPGWVLSWPMILIAIGTFSLVKHEFRSFFGAVMLFLGSYFLLRNEVGFDFGLGQYVWPIGLIVLGLYLIFQKRRENQVLDDIRKNWESKNKSGFSSSYNKTEDAKIVDESTSQFQSGTGAGEGFTRTTGTSFADRLNIDAIFSGVNRRMMSKNFQGGKITAAFGGAEIDLTQSDFELIS